MNLVLLEIGGREEKAGVGTVEVVLVRIICLYTAINGAVSSLVMRRYLYLSAFRIAESMSWLCGKRATIVSLVHIPVHIRAVVGEVLSQLARVN